MTPARLKDLRLSLGLSASQFALALGYGGTKAARGNYIYHLETGVRPIPATMKYRVAALLSRTNQVWNQSSDPLENQSNQD